MSQERRSILITGTSSGFGLLSSVALAQKGYVVYATMRNPAKKENLLAACKEAGVEVVVRALDVTMPETIAPVIEEMERQYSGPDVLINNAGFGYGGFFEDTSNENFEDQLATNFYGAMNCARAVLPGMRKRGHGLILNVSSQSGRSGLPGLSAYTASKFAMEGWSESLRFEVKQFGIYVVLLEPGVFKTNICADGHRKAAADSKNENSAYFELYQKMERGTLRYMELHGQDPTVVIKKIVKIISIKKPKLRYLVGMDARWESFFKIILPSPIFEKIVEKFVEKYNM